MLVLGKQWGTGERKGDLLSVLFFVIVAFIVYLIDK